MFCERDSPQSTRHRRSLRYPLPKDPTKQQPAICGRGHWRNVVGGNERRRPSRSGIRVSRICMCSTSTVGYHHCMRVPGLLSIVTYEPTFAFQYNQTFAISSFFCRHTVAHCCGPTGQSLRDFRQRYLISPNQKISFCVCPLQHIQ